jgi:hypothetical protein
MQSALRQWRALNGSGLLSDVIDAHTFVDASRETPPPDGVVIYNF